MGAKTKDLIILEKEMEAVAGNLYITTDNGSYGRSGMVTKVIDDLVAEGKKYTRCVAIGSYHYDEILLPDHKEVRNSDDCIHESDYGRRYRNVRCMPCYRRWRSKIRMCITSQNLMVT